MNIRLANECDLQRLKEIYTKVVNHMKRENICIWDDVYPCEFLINDIKGNHLYLLVEDNNILGAFALSDSNSGEKYIQWNNPYAKALYIDRFAVNIDYIRQGIGGIMLQHAANITRDRGIEYLRLFVVEENIPAINLYTKNGFKKLNGVYEEHIEDFVLREYGFEMKI
ncbi:MAG: GNAT family N-acetyltransferase [Clostridium sp.]